MAPRLEGELARQAVTKHLHVLASVGLVHSERIGRETRWRIRPEGLDDAHASPDRISAAWDEALDRLRASDRGWFPSPRRGVRAAT